jgi:hypothetical protein
MSGTSVRSALLLLIFCSQLTLGLTMNAAAKNADGAPPLAPEGEKIAQNDPDFATACLARVHYLAPTGQWKLGEPLLTHNDKWGLVWRVDFKYPHDDLAPLINRVICWRTDDGKGVNAEIAIGQHLAPLHVGNRGLG